MRISTFFLFLILSLVNFNLSAQDWEITEMSLMPERVTNNAVVEGFSNGKAYVYSFAGMDSTKTGAGAHLKSYRYDVENDLWETIEDLPDFSGNGGKVAASASRIGDIIYIIGGYHILPNGSEISSNLVHRYDVINNQFLADGKSILLKIDDQVQSVWRDSLIYVVTGWSGGTAGGSNTPNIQIYNPTTDNWSFGSQMPNNDLYKSFGSSGYIVGDTIFYFGGASSSCCNPPFPIQSQLRKGIIDPSNPQSISWSIVNQPEGKVGYRMAASKINQEICWIGGSGDTYNFDGLSYLDDSGVAPLNRILSFAPKTNSWNESLLAEIPMDLRGIGETSPTTRYLAGGMLANQWVSNKTYRLEYLGDIVANSIIQSEDIQVFPNPVDQFVQIILPLNMPKATYRLSNNLGMVLLEKVIHSNSIQIDLSNFPEGIYHLQILYLQQQLPYKLLKISQN